MLKYLNHFVLSIFAFLFGNSLHVNIATESPIVSYTLYNKRNRNAKIPGNWAFLLILSDSRHFIFVFTFFAVFK